MTIWLRAGLALAVAAWLVLGVYALLLVLLAGLALYLLQAWTAPPA